MKITLLGQTKTYSVYSIIDNTYTHNILTYRLWEDLDMPQLKAIDESFAGSNSTRETCIGSFIKTKILDHMISLLFYVAKKGGAHRAQALLSTQWMSKTKSLFPPNVQDQPTSKVNSFNLTGSRTTEPPRETSQLLPQNQTTTFKKQPKIPILSQEYSSRALTLATIP